MENRPDIESNPETKLTKPGKGAQTATDARSAPPESCPSATSFLDTDTRALKEAAKKRLRESLASLEPELAKENPHLSDQEEEATTIRQQPWREPSIGIRQREAETIMAEAGNCEPEAKDSSRPKRKVFSLGKLRNAAVSQPNGTNQHLGIEAKMDRVISVIFQMLNEMQKEIAVIKQHLGMEIPLPNEESSEYQEHATAENTEEPIESNCGEACYNQPATEDHIFCISKELVKDWKPLLTQLGLTQADVDVIDTDVRGCEEKVREALVRWRRSKAPTATVERLLAALNNIGRRDVSEILKKSIDDDFTGTTHSEVKCIMEFFSDCIELWKKTADKEVNLFNQLESLEIALEQIEQDPNGGAQNTVDQEDCWAQSRALKNIIAKLNTLAGELVKANNSLVMEKVFDLLIRVRDGSNRMAKKLAWLEEGKADMEEDDREELVALGKNRCLRLKELDELRKRFEDSWGEKWQQLQLQKTQSEPPMSRKEWQTGRKVRVLYQFRQYILRMIKEEHP